MLHTHSRLGCLDTLFMILAAHTVHWITASSPKLTLRCQKVCYLFLTLSITLFR